MKIKNLFKTSKKLVDGVMYIRRDGFTLGHFMYINSKLGNDKTEIILLANQLLTNCYDNVFQLHVRTTQKIWNELKHSKTIKLIATSEKAVR